MQNFAKFIVETAFAVLLAVDPLALVVFFRNENESSFAMFAAVLVFTFVGRAVAPDELPLAMHFAFLPVSLVLRVIRKNGSALPLRRE